VSIGLAGDGRAALGIAYNPAREEMLAAGYEPAGMTLNGSPVRVSETSDLGHARVTVSRKEWRRGLDPLAATRSVMPMASMAY
jgi:fructose-1,6-bisphosphatase/inositol monophosphatase family enzyme